MPTQFVYRGTPSGSTREERAKEIRRRMRESQRSGGGGVTRVDFDEEKKAKHTSFEGVKSPEVEQAIVERMAQRGDTIVSGRHKTKSQEISAAIRQGAVGRIGNVYVSEGFAKAMQTSEYETARFQEEQEIGSLRRQAHEQYVQRGIDLQKQEQERKTQEIQSRYWRPEFKEAVNKQEAIQWYQNKYYTKPKTRFWKWEEVERPKTEWKDGKLVIVKEKTRGYYSTKHFLRRQTLLKNKGNMKHQD